LNFDQANTNKNKVEEFDPVIEKKFIDGILPERKEGAKVAEQKSNLKKDVKKATGPKPRLWK